MGRSEGEVGGKLIMMERVMERVREIWGKKVGVSEGERG